MAFNIYSAYRWLQPRFRRKRWRHFLQTFAVDSETPILDVGGHPGEWMSGVDMPVTVTVVNVGPWPESLNAPPRFTYCEADARVLPFADASFELAYSNSVIEHVGTWEDQEKFAHEIRRVGRNLYVQTPNRWFPIEPHFLALFVHWLPRSWHRRLLPILSLRGWFRKGDDVDASRLAEEVRLLSFAEMKRLFPDCEIYRERVFGFVKSLIAIRRSHCPPDPATRALATVNKHPAGHALSPT
jgi:hypothetical protein